MADEKSGRRRQVGHIEGCLALPKITAKIRKEWSQPVKLIDKDGEWSQEAVDFACMIKCEMYGQETQ